MNKQDPGTYQLGNFITDESFIRFCLGQNKRDIKFWQDWINANPEKKMIAEEAAEWIRKFSLKLPEYEYQEELSKIRARLQQEEGTGGIRSVIKFLNWPKPALVPGNKRKRLFRWVLPVLIGLIVTGYFLNRHTLVSDSGLIVNYNKGSIPLVLTLSDSTVITLAPHSELRYPRIFDSKIRKVYLNGEASFHVAADTAHPFKVFQDDLVATVLGTIFSIRKERRDSVVMVELMQGKLKVEIPGNGSSEMQSVMLEPNERVVYSQNNRQLFKEKWQITNGTPVRLAHLLFRRDNFGEIAKKIQISFGITLIDRSDKKPWRFTGEFTNATAAEIVASICKVEGLTSAMEGDTILIK